MAPPLSARVYRASSSYRGRSGSGGRVGGGTEACIRAVAGIAFVLLLAQRLVGERRAAQQRLRRDGAQHPPVGPVRQRAAAGQRRPSGADVRRPDAAVRSGHGRRHRQVLQVRGLRRSARTAPGRPRACRAPGSRSSATASTSRTSTRRPTTTASGPRAGSPPRTAGCCSQQTRFNARVAALDVPGVTAIDLISNLRASRRASDRGRAREADRRAARRRGRGPAGAA